MLVSPLLLLLLFLLLLVALPLLLLQHLLPMLLLLLLLLLPMLLFFVALIFLLLLSPPRLRLLCFARWTPAVSPQHINACGERMLARASHLHECLVVSMPAELLQWPES